MESPECSNDVKNHFRDDFLNNFNSSVAAVKSKSMENISELKHDVAELRWYTNSLMVDETEFLWKELTAKIKL